MNAGELQVTGTLNGPVAVRIDSTSDGTGTVAHVLNSGRVQPGTSTSIGTLHVNGNYTQTSGTTEIKLTSTGNTPGVNNDNLNITGTAKLGGSLKVLA